MANVVSVNISERKGEQKHPVPEIQLKFRHGIVGDAHAGDWHRQISLLAWSYDSMAWLRRIHGRHTWCCMVGIFPVLIPADRKSVV